MKRLHAFQISILMLITQALANERTATTSAIIGGAFPMERPFRIWRNFYEIIS